MTSNSNTVTVIRDIAMVASGIALISYFHFFPLHLEFMSHETFHILLRRLYYVPIFYAAIRFGLKGGVIASLTATALFAPHAARTLGGFLGPISVDNLFDIILYNVVGLTTGLVVDSRRRQAHRYEEVVNLNREIEDRETAIRHMQAYTQSILSSVSSGVISCDRRGVVVTANPVARRLLGLGEEDIVGFPLSRVFPGHSELLRAARLILSGEQKRATLETCLAIEGRTLTVAVRITPHLSRGRTVGAVITLEDLTEVKDLTEQLLRADRLSGLGELVAGVAHEVRNPLGVIRASVQMLDQEMETGSGAAELNQVMLQEIDRLDSVVGALLDFGSPSESQFGHVEPVRVLDEVMLLTRHFAQQQEIDIAAGYPAELPGVWAEEDRLKQVFLNLISNAIQAMPGGGSLKVSAAPRDGYLRVEVTDTGGGIPPEEQKRIFDPFHTTRAEGSGLGLAIVHRIVDAHNGFITVDSEPGRGSTFTVGIPLSGAAITGTAIDEPAGEADDD
ncbi:MAG: PAS domain-containing protein [Thermoleophilia bacterium]|nr:PAS domain-containing protein [Thermoleophilia bacterium]